jgi:hypothetical protein
MPVAGTWKFLESSDRHLNAVRNQEFCSGRGKNADWQPAAIFVIML